VQGILAEGHAGKAAPAHIGTGQGDGLGSTAWTAIQEIASAVNRHNGCIMGIAGRESNQINQLTNNQRANLAGAANEVLVNLKHRAGILEVDDPAADGVNGINII